MGINYESSNFDAHRSISTKVENSAATTTSRPSFFFASIEEREKTKLSSFFLSLVTLLLLAFIFFVYFVLPISLSSRSLSLSLSRSVFFIVKWWDKYTRTQIHRRRSSSSFAFVSLCHERRWQIQLRTDRTRLEECWVIEPTGQWTEKETFSLYTRRWMCLIFTHWPSARGWEHSSRAWKTHPHGNPWKTFVRLNYLHSLSCRKGSNQGLALCYWSNLLCKGLFCQQRLIVVARRLLQLRYRPEATVLVIKARRICSSPVQRKLGQLAYVWLFHRKKKKKKIKRKR